MWAGIAFPLPWAGDLPGLAGHRSAAQVAVVAAEVLGAGRETAAHDGLVRRFRLGLVGPAGRALVVRLELLGGTLLLRAIGSLARGRDRSALRCGPSVRCLSRAACECEQPDDQAEQQRSMKSTPGPLSVQSTHGSHGGRIGTTPPGAEPRNVGNRLASASPQRAAARLPRSCTSSNSFCVRAQSPAMCTAMLRSLAPCRCSHRNTPCQVPSASCPSMIGTEREVVVSADLMWAGMSSGPSVEWV